MVPVIAVAFFFIADSGFDLKRARVLENGEGLMGSESLAGSFVTGVVGTRRFLGGMAMILFYDDSKSIYLEIKLARFVL
jgi:hypothetical protein